jgi:hypothetical protein
MERPGQAVGDYGSGGWGFESLAARINAQVNGLGLLAA